MPVRIESLLAFSIRFKQTDFCRLSLKEGNSMEHFLELFVNVVLKVGLPLIECSIKVIECHLKIIEAKKKGAVSTPKKTQRSSVRRHSRKR